MEYSKAKETLIRSSNETFRDRSAGRGRHWSRSDGTGDPGAQICRPQVWLRDRHQADGRRRRGHRSARRGAAAADAESVRGQSGDSLRIGRRSEMGVAAAGEAAGAGRAPAVAKALRPVLQSASRQGVQGAGPRLPAAAGHRRRRIRHSRGARTDRRCVLRPASGSKGPRWIRSGRARLGHQGVFAPTDRAHRAQSVRGGPCASQERDFRGQGERADEHGVLA